mgnify:CR=1 FL=1
MAILKGKRTYISLAVTLLTILGATNYVSPVELSSVVTNVIEVGGVLLAAYFRYKA